MAVGKPASTLACQQKGKNTPLFLNIESNGRFKQGNCLDIKFKI